MAQKKVIKRNIIALQMQHRHKNGGSAGYHSKKGYSRKEKHKKSVLPFWFWLLSLIGSLLILSYAIIRRDPVLFIGHIFGSMVYARNLILLKRNDD